MATSIKLDITGHKEIDKVLRSLPAQLSQKVMLSAHRQALKPLVEKAKLLAPEGANGHLVDSIGTQVLRATKGKGGIAAGPRRTRRYKGYAGHLVEYGTTDRHQKSGRGTGKMGKKPFMAPAWNSTKRIVESSVADKIGKTLYSFMKRTIKANP